MLKLLIFLSFASNIFSNENNIVQIGDHIIELQDWTKPTLNDYLNLQQFLSDTLPERLKFIDSPYRRDRISDYKLIDSKKMILPYMTIEKFGNKTKDVVITYCSQNPGYMYKVERLKFYLKQNHFRGTFIHYNGGWPNVKEGCLKHCMVPYMFKVCALLEARRLGYERILWLDSSLIPLKKIDPLFDYIEEHDCLFRLDPQDRYLKNDTGLHWNEVRKFLPITDEEIERQPRVGGCVLGLNLKSDKVNEFLNIWHELGKLGLFYKTHLPEELPMSILLNKMGFLDKSHDFFFLKDIIKQDGISDSNEAYFKLYYFDRDPFKNLKKKKN